MYKKKSPPHDRSVKIVPHGNKSPPVCNEDHVAVNEIFLRKGDQYGQD